MTWKGQPRTGTGAWRKLRLLVLERDGHICYRCRQPTATEVDHVVPSSKGGSDEPANLAAICAPCHRTKSAREGNAARPRAAREAERHPGYR